MGADARFIVHPPVTAWRWLRSSTPFSASCDSPKPYCPVFCVLGFTEALCHAASHFLRSQPLSPIWAILSRIICDILEVIILENALVAKARRAAHCRSQDSSKKVTLAKIPVYIPYTSFIESSGQANSISEVDFNRRHGAQLLIHSSMSLRLVCCSCCDRP